MCQRKHRPTGNCVRVHAPGPPQESLESNGTRSKEVEVEDAGTYICKATNGFGSVSINYTLIVIDDSGADKTGPGVPGGVDSEYDPDHLSGKLVRPRFTQPAKMRKRVIARPVGSSVRLKCTASGNLGQTFGKYTCRISNQAGEINATYKVEVI
ncbi:fibroblast growth factor receptor-like 1, partial [Oncorhynchus nerka]|uniref:fibroblast growth factor receptor-like 1 n=1 Tax=Oncorhynchus nerka TaxID=8023 RepID=UPI0031B81AA9